MRKVSASVGIVAALASLVVPWVYYGDIGFYVYSALVASIYVCAVALLCVCTFLGSRLAQVVGVGAGLAVVGFTVSFLFSYNDPSVFFDGPVPAVIPHLGVGPFLALLSAAFALPVLLRRGGKLSPP
ncbi:hypothetical protein [Streptomyces sp. NPDC059452]|uniref:hypothetical protein n=1 Tax=Streptomyces sp. NPDC059452 TaxID=3346835 RepID=UPI003690F010